MTDGYGIPPERILAGANRNDLPLPAPTLDLLEDLGPLPGEVTVHLAPVTTPARPAPHWASATCTADRPPRRQSADPGWPANCTAVLAPRRPRTAAAVLAGVCSASRPNSRRLSWRRTSPTSRVSTVMPGSSTRSLSMCTTARSNSARGPSVVDHARAATRRHTSASASAKSRHSSCPPICQECSYTVCARRPEPPWGPRSETPQHPHGAPLHRPTQIRRRAPPLTHLLERGLIQPEEPLQLTRRPLLREPSIAGDLLIREKFEGHDPGTYEPSPEQARPAIEPKRTSTPYR